MSDAKCRPLKNGFCPEQPWFVFNAAPYYSLITPQNPAISHFYSFDAACTNEQLLVIPDGCVDILFDCDDASPAARICGSPFEVRQLELMPGHRYFGVRYAPGVMPDFPALAAEELAGQEFSFSDVTPGDHKVFEQIVQTSSFSQQVTIFNRHFMPRLSRNPSPLTKALIKLIRENKGNIRIQHLETLTGYTVRTMQRQFRLDTGFSPKAFSRIIRCQTALNRFNLSSMQPLAEQALELGFSDQPHFQREFRALVGATPLDYQRRISRETYMERIRHH